MTELQPIPWNENPAVRVPLLAPAVLGVIERAEFGRFSAKQRAWFLRRDNHTCQDPDCKIGPRPDGRGLHVHHIVPQGFWERWFNGRLGEEAESPHQPWNGITLCAEGHHNGAFGVHPDYNQALIDYRAGNKQSFKKVAKKHGDLADVGEVYWNTQKDNLYFQIADERTEEYLAKQIQEQGLIYDPFPEE